MSLKIRLEIVLITLLLSTNFISCQSDTPDIMNQNSKNTEESNKQEEEEEEEENKITQFVQTSNDQDLEGLPVSSHYIKEQSLKGQNTSPYGYVVRRPEGFGQDGLKYPILIYLHGMGSRGNSQNNPDDINKVDKDGAIRAIKKGHWNPKVAIPVFAPQSSTSWNAGHLKAFITYLIDTYPTSINTDRIYISGFSMGAAGIWTYLDRYGYENSFVAAAVTMAGAKEDSAIESLKLMPFWAFHGQKDGTVPVSKSISLVDKFKASYPGQNHQKLTIFTQDDFDGQYHRIDHGIYDRSSWNKNHTGDAFDTDVVNWMLQYRRND